LLAASPLILSKGRRDVYLHSLLIVVQHVRGRSRKRIVVCTHKENHLPEEIYGWSCDYVLTCAFRRNPAKRDVIAHPANGTCTHVLGTLPRQIRNACSSSCLIVVNLPGLATWNLNIFFKLKINFDNYHYFLYATLYIPQNASGMRVVNIFSHNAVIKDKFIIYYLI